MTPIPIFFPLFQNISHSQPAQMRLSEAKWVCSEGGQVGRTNGYSRRASKEKQIFALDLLVSKYIPGIQMTFPPVPLPAP